MSDGRDIDGPSLIQVAIRVVGYCCVLTAFIAVATFFVIRFLVGTG
jgi:hypothetical protein